MNSESLRIADQLRRAFGGDAWHGPPLRDILTGVTAQRAHAHLLPSAHSIWELVLHLTTWERVITHRMKGQALMPSDDENFPQVSVATDVGAGELDVPVNKSQVLRSDRPYAKALIGNPDIADGEEALGVVTVVADKMFA